jgi:hypothetical protein
MRPRIGELLLEAGVIDEEQLDSALGLQVQTGKRLGQILVDLEALDEETLTRTLARQLNIPVVWLRGKSIRRDVLDLVPTELIEKHRCLPVQLDRRGEPTLMLAMHDPSDIAAIDEVAQRSELPVKPVLAAPSELEEAIVRHRPVDPGDSLACAEFMNAPDEEGPDVLSMQEIRVPPPPSPDATARALPPLSIDESEKPPQPDASPAGEQAAPPVPAQRPDASVAQNDLVLRALTQLLVEKGIVSRDELIARLGALKKGDRDALGEG